MAAFLCQIVICSGQVKRGDSDNKIKYNSICKTLVFCKNEVAALFSYFDSA